MLIGILLISSIPILANHSTAAKTKAISFNSYLAITYDTTPLNNPLQIDVSVVIPINVQFWTNIPAVFTKIPFPLNNLILFGSPIGPEEKIHLEILNPPDWANIFFSTSDVLTDIPFKTDGKKNITTNLIISPKVEAPAEPQTIIINASCETLKRLNGFSFQVRIPFTPSFLPTIGINPENPIRTVGPHESVSFNIIITNNGNKITRVTPKIIGSDPQWTSTINPPVYEIQPNQQTTFTFSIITPYNFGWHNEYGRFEVNFLSEVYPYRNNSPSQNQTIFLVVNNHGFSAPGFEFVIFLFAIIAILFIIRNRRMKN